MGCPVHTHTSPSLSGRTQVNLSFQRPSCWLKEIKPISRARLGASRPFTLFVPGQRDPHEACPHSVPRHRLGHRGRPQPPSCLLVQPFSGFGEHIDIQHELGLGLLRSIQGARGSLAPSVLRSGSTVPPRELSYSCMDLHFLVLSTGTYDPLSWK